MKVLLLLSVVLLIVATAPSAAGSERLTLSVSPMRSMAPSLVRVRARVEPNPENRLLRITADSEHFFRQSDVQLDGDESPATVQMELRNLPGGEYEVTGVLVDSTGNQCAVARAEVTVISLIGTP